MPERMPRSLPWLVAATVLAVGAFQWGAASAGSSADRSRRRRTPIVEAVEHVSPAVVSVDAVLSYGRGYVGRSTGAGVIVHPDGYVVTNSHVIRGGQSVTVDRFGPGGRYQARVVADDPGGDLALLQIQGGGPFAYVSLCSTRRLMLGETAIAIGSPHGLGDSITVGVVSALGRSAKMQQGGVLRNLVQTDASINTGNSGGPLINLDGELIGINVSVLPSAKGIAFAIGADAVQALLGRALGGRGLPGRNALPDDAPEGDLTPFTPLPTTPPPTAARPPSGSPTPARPSIPPPSLTGGPDTGELPPPAVTTPLRPSDFGFELRDDGCRIFVATVQPGSSAAIAGLQAEDIVLSVDGSPVEDDGDLVLAFASAEPGRVYSLEVRRGPKTKRVLLITPR